MKKTNSYIRFNYPLIPYVWLRVPRSVAKWVSTKDVFIDTHLGRKRKAH